MIASLNLDHVVENSAWISKLIDLTLPQQLTFTLRGDQQSDLFVIFEKLFYKNNFWANILYINLIKYFGAFF